MAATTIESVAAPHEWYGSTEQIRGYWAAGAHTDRRESARARVRLEKWVVFGLTVWAHRRRDWHHHRKVVRRSRKLFDRCGGNGEKKKKKKTREYMIGCAAAGPNVCCLPSHSDRKESKNKFIIFTCRRRLKRALALWHPSERSFGGATQNLMLWRSVWVCVRESPNIRGRLILGSRSDRTRSCAHSRHCWYQSITIKHITFYAIPFFFQLRKQKIEIHEWSELDHWF